MKAKWMFPSYQNLYISGYSSNTKVKKSVLDFVRKCGFRAYCVTKLANGKHIKGDEYFHIVYICRIN